MTGGLRSIGPVAIACTEVQRRLPRRGVAAFENGLPATALSVPTRHPLHNDAPLALAFVTAKKPLESAEATAAFEKEILRQVDSTLGAVARPARVYVVNAMPKTRSGKLLRRTLQAVAEGRDPGDLSTIDDPASLLAIRDLIAQK